jgi:ribosome biogenesis GTPase
MSGRSKRGSRARDLTSSFLAGELDVDRVEGQQRFGKRSKFHQLNKTARTAAARAKEAAAAEAAVAAAGGDVEQLPAGQVVQVYSRYVEIEHDGRRYLSVIRKTMGKVAKTPVVVGDRVRFLPTDTVADDGRPEAVIERIEPRQTILVRTDSFLPHLADPIVTNAQQMLLVASVWAPFPRWGLIDRMLVAAQSGKLEAVVCLNKIDLARGEEDGEPQQQYRFALEALDHYRRLGVRTLQTSAEDGTGLDELRDILRGRETVLAGHSGVGKSRLVRAVQPGLDIRVGAVSEATIKGRHTTTSSRRYPLDLGGAVIDTPGMKVFGLWGVSRENLVDYFPDVADDTAPQWRAESYERIFESLPR